MEKVIKEQLDEYMELHNLSTKYQSGFTRNLSCELECFRSYLTERKQMTKVNGTKSGELNNELGVPQGSILTALLFIIYINADDTLIHEEGETDV